MLQGAEDRLIFFLLLFFIGTAVHIRSEDCFNLIGYLKLEGYFL